MNCPLYGRQLLHMYAACVTQAKSMIHCNLETKRKQVFDFTYCDLCTLSFSPKLTNSDFMKTPLTFRAKRQECTQLSVFTDRAFLKWLAVKLVNLQEFKTISCLNPFGIVFSTLWPPNGRFFETGSSVLSAVDPQRYRQVTKGTDISLLRTETNGNVEFLVKFRLKE